MNDITIPWGFYFVALCRLSASLFSSFLIGKWHHPLANVLVLKAHKVNREKLHFAQTQVWYLDHLISEQELHLHPHRFHGVLSFLKPKTKCQLWGFLRLVDYCQNWIQVAKLLYFFTKKHQPWSDFMGRTRQHKGSLKGEFDELTLPWAPQMIIFPFLCLYVKKKGTPLGCSFQMWAPQLTRSIL